MKIGIQTDLLDTNGYGRWNEQMYIKLAEHGFACTDFAMANTNTPIYNTSLNNAEKILLHEKRLADEAGIEIVQTHGPWRWPAQDLSCADRTERMEKMKKAIHFTSLLGCKKCVVHPIMPYGISDKNTPEAFETYRMNMEFFTELLKTARQYGVTICLENMPYDKFSLAGVSSLCKLVGEVNDDYLKICLDTGHSFVLGEATLSSEIKMLGRYLDALHIHDNKMNTDLHLMPYFGNIDWKDFAKALKDIDYKGNFTLETMPPRKLPTPIFEQMCILLVQTAQEIVSYPK